MSPLVYVILLNYNNYDDTIECIKSLEKVTYKNYRVIIVDNNSQNNSEQVLRDTFPQYKIIQTGKNLGFAGGNNVGIKEALNAGAEYILLLNNDTTVEEKFLDKMMECSQDNPEAGVIGGKVLNYFNKEVVEYSGGYIDFFKYVTVHKTTENDDKPREVDFVTGCMMLIKSEVFNYIGLFSEHYFMYYEDTDFCVKIKDSGYKIIYTPEAWIYHKVSKSSGGDESPFSIKWNIRNRLIFMNKYKHKSSMSKYALSCLYFYITRLIRYFMYLYKKDKERAGAVIDGVREGRRYLRSK